MQSADAAPRLSRRKFLKLGLAAAAVGVPTSAAASTRDIEVTRHSVKLPNLPPSTAGLTICQLSDLHCSPIVPEHYLREAAELAVSLKPDVIVLTGDYVTRDAEFIHEAIRALRPLKAPLGTFAIMGNHDAATDSRLIARSLAEAGYHMLINASHELESGLYLCGIDDLWSGVPNLRKTLADVPADAACVLLSHVPVIIDEMKRPSLILSGHTHGGQINLGPLSGIATPEVTYNGRFMSGWYGDGDVRMYINRGLGVVGLPLRFRSRPEISFFTLESA